LLKRLSPKRPWQQVAVDLLIARTQRLDAGHKIIRDYFGVEKLKTMSSVKVICQLKGYSE